jgi:hypothetical protein
MDHWTAEVDEILAGDHTVMLVYATPADGAVLLPVNNYAARRDRGTGTLTAINSSVGGWRKLERIRRNPRVALAFHTRDHGLSDRPEYVLVQGRAALSEPIPDYPASIPERWERFEPWSETNSLWKRWQRIYALRVEIELAVERVIVWPNLTCEGTPAVHGAPLAERSPPPQEPPRKGTGPRLNAGRAASRASGLPHALLGWVGADGYPIAVPVGILGAEAKGIALVAPDGIVPPGGRRAGLTAHRFSQGAVGQNQRKHTGWLEAPGGSRRLLYAPHTQSNYRFPPSKTLYRLVLGGATRWGARGARDAGFL